MSEVENHVDVVKIDFKSSNFWPSNIFNLKSNSKLFSDFSKAWSLLSNPIKDFRQQNDMVLK